MYKVYKYIMELCLKLFKSKPSAIVKINWWERNKSLNEMYPQYHPNFHYTFPPEDDLRKKRFDELIGIKKRTITSTNSKYPHIILNTENRDVSNFLSQIEQVINSNYLPIPSLNDNNLHTFVDGSVYSKCLVNDEFQNDKLTTSKINRILKYKNESITTTNIITTHISNMSDSWNIGYDNGVN